jgi:hypothetical protein
MTQPNSRVLIPALLLLLGAFGCATGPSVSVEEHQADLRVALAKRNVGIDYLRTGRTPMDRPIVMVVGHRDTNGHIHLAITGMGTHVVALSPGETGLLEPSSDFRGSSRYRKELATVLTKRVLADLSGGGSE